MRDGPIPCEILAECPVCREALFLATTLAKLKICICIACGTSLTVPDEAWLEAKARQTRLSA